MAKAKTETTRKSWTVRQVFALGPCYDLARIKSLFGARRTLTLAQVLDLDIPAADRVWFATQNRVLASAVRAAWIEGIVRRAVTQHALRCGVPAVEAWAQGWLDGTDRSEAAAARAGAAPPPPQ